MKNRQHRQQVADLILLDPNAKDLVISSALVTVDNSMSFEVTEPIEGARYKVTLKIEEI